MQQADGVLEVQIIYARIFKVIFSSVMLKLM